MSEAYSDSPSMTSQQLFQCVVGFGKGYDWPSGEIAKIIFHGPDSQFPREHVPYYQRIGDIVCSLYGDYDFVRSPRFLSQISGKSPEFCRMKLKMETTPEKRKMHSEAFLKALDGLPTSRAVYEILDSSRHVQLDQIVEALRQIALKPASPAIRTSESQKAELDLLLNEALRMALHLLGKQGAHIPFAMITTPEGRRLDIAPDNSDVQDRKILFATVRGEVVKRIEQRGVRAFALAQEVLCKRPDNGAESAAVEVALEHIEGMSVVCYLPYSIANGVPIPDEVFASDATEKLFKEA